MVNSGVKEFPFTVNASHSALNSCQRSLIRFEIRMKDLSPLPTFVTLNSLANTIKITNPPTLGSYVLQILVRDIYGDYDAIDVTVNIEEVPMAPL